MHVGSRGLRVGQQVEEGIDQNETVVGVGVARGEGGGDEAAVGDADEGDVGGAVAQLGAGEEEVLDGFVNVANSDLQ